MRPNLSTTCPFVRHSPNQTVVFNTHNNTTETTSVTAEDMNILNELDKINTEEEFDSCYDGLERALIARMMGTSGDKDLRQSLLNMEKRINKSISEKGSK